MPLLRTAMYAKGIEPYCAPTLDWHDSWIASMRHIDVEGRFIVFSCNLFARRSDCPSEFDCVMPEAPDATVSRGGSWIIDPFGEMLAGPHFDEEIILLADFNQSAIARGKYDFDSVGNYARPDVFQLLVDERAKRPVTPLRDTVFPSNVQNIEGGAR